MSPRFPNEHGSAQNVVRGLSGLLLGTCLALLAGCLHSPTLSSKGLQDAVTTEHELRELLRPRRVALLVGVDNYVDPSFPDLQYSRGDATALSEVLSSPTGGGFEEVTVLAGPENTTRVRILRELRLLSRRLGPEDILVVYFSGHGTLAPVDENEAALYLLPSDANASNLAGSALELNSLRAFLGELPAQRKAMIVDACFNADGKSVANPTVGTGNKTSIEGRPQVRSGELGEGESYLFASSLGRPAFEDDELGRGVYTHYLLQSMTWARQQSDLDGDGVLTAWEAHDYARDRTRDHTGGVQVPEAAIRVVGSNDLVMVGDPSQRAERDRALIFSYETPRELDGAVLVVNGRSKGVFPGTVALSPGRHHVEVRDRDGDWISGGYMEVEPGESISYSEVALRTKQERGFTGLRLLVGGGPTASWGALWGDAFTQIEFSYAFRKSKAPAAGLYGGFSISAGFSPTRVGYINNHQVPRPALGAAAELGWSYNKKRLRLRVGGSGRLTFLPILHDEPMGSFPLNSSEAGWIIGSLGPTLHVGIALSPQLALMVGGSVQLSFVELNEGDGIKAHPYGLFSAGLEHSF